MMNDPYSYVNILKIYLYHRKCSKVTAFNEIPSKVVFQMVFAPVTYGIIRFRIVEEV